MILYKAAKYIILEYCISSIFNKLVKNLSLHGEIRMGIEDVKTGMHFSIIKRVGEFNNYECYDCKVLSIDRFDDFDGVRDEQPYYFIEFEFGSCSYKTSNNFYYLKIPISTIPTVEFII